ncbi:type I-C CRISPR-associated protein Cas8c/Csd1, partial [Bacillus pumilus]|uniref:type I-C CRISPR-associated protein Cas8c/Csd1 n=1 Tax=Bacillus pumilus TaxID=1408 RepID=UPI003C1BAE8D
NKDEAVTVIPCTEASANRTSSAVAPHPLHEKLIYVAGDFETYGGKRKDHCVKYIENLKLWNNSLHSHSKVSSILTYIKKKSLIKD